MGDAVARRAGGWGGRNDLMHVLHTAEHTGFGNFPQGVFFSFFFGFMSALFVYFETPSSIILFCVESPLVRVSFMLYSSFSCASPAKVFISPVLEYGRC